jgi:GAF domain-containing protein
MSDRREPDELTPVRQSREAFDWLSTFGDDQVERSVMQMASRVREIAPDCVALSLTVAHGDLTFTVMTDRPGASLLDAMQYLDGGPCVRAVDEDETTTTSDLPTDEGRWQLFARAEKLTGISSTLSMPVIREGRTIGGVNLYAATNDAFDGHHEELAEACGAWADGAITNADLDFTSRVRAATAPDRLRDRGDLDVAVGVVAEHQSVDLVEARTRIHSAATRASVSDAEFARFILDAHADDLGRRA